ncbi:hypoxia-inducible factor 1, alpha subunit inhibitor, putative [Ixodes scapularis]|uniref:Hypoxia-inducible factor 1, alpha subunit inhibitor, putative n=2 Tax=Ixodes scapularis TaxID=6945 RepID=B7Q8M1_IXOSC|nr:hypoxia-inducible factor 1, alpha subunit inhibitor, putative [Ixodes scapularis]|eukprot:XP_002412378.1 hypoxia-inducible factor 1, alpha subunit inhibitor, putative [Ixodes scapularis]
MAQSECEGCTGCSSLDFQDYGIPLEAVPRLSHTDPEADRLIANMMPVVLTDTGLVAPALKWDLDYLSEHLGEGSCTVYQSDTPYFKYYDETKVRDHRLTDFRAPTLRHEWKIGTFAQRLRSAGHNKYYYLQQMLNETVGQSIMLDFLRFNWDWVNRQQKHNGWGPLTSNLLLVGTGGNVTPAHYDEQQNFFAHLRGHKRFLLFSPDQYGCLYPHPVWHPHDRQSQVDFSDPDLSRFPEFAHLRGWETVLGPGDVLYLPMYWWHQVESAPGKDYTVSVNFWYKAAPVDKVIYPRMGHQKMAIMRNIEKVLVEALRDVNEVGPLLRAMVLGRYT